MDELQATLSSGEDRHEHACPKPLLWWPGGKTGMLPAIRPLRPATFRGYHEPFCGGLASYLDLWSPGMAGNAWLSDANEELVRCYRAIRSDPHAVVAAFHRRIAAHSGRLFRMARRESVSSLADVEVAGRLLYLTKVSYNGLYRVDRRGRFATGLGHDRSGEKRHAIDEKNVVAVSRALRDADLGNADFTAVLARAKPGDFVFLDPPYPSVHCAYTALGFTDGDHRRLRDVCSELDRIGAMWLQTNRDCRLIRNLYRDYRMTTAQVYRRAGNPSGASRAQEVIITNY